MKRIKTFSNCPTYEILFSHKLGKYEHKDDGLYFGIYAFKTRKGCLIDLYDLAIPWYDVMVRTSFKEDLFLNSNICIASNKKDEDIISRNLLKADHGRFSEYLVIPKHNGYKNKDRQLYLIFIKKDEVNKINGSIKKRVLIYFAIRKDLKSKGDLSWIIYNSQTKKWQSLEENDSISFIKYIILPTETITYDMYKDAL